MKPLISLTLKDLKKLQIVDWGYTQQMQAHTFDKFSEWINAGEHGSLGYLADYRKDKRKNLKEYYPEAKSALVFTFDYTPAKKNLASKNQKKIAAYTVGFEGIDYHYWIKEKLNYIGGELKKIYPEIEYKLSLDVHPVLERDLAYRAGLGWFGKNSMLISKEHGSYQLIGSIILNRPLELEIRDTGLDHCGSCTRCIDACPTSAIDSQARTIVADKCISTFTIEKFKEEAPPAGYPTKTKEVFGCDICQEVCPWNTKPISSAVDISIDSKLVEFFNREFSLVFNDIEKMSNNEFKRFFAQTSFVRSGKRGLLKNLKPYL